MSWHWHLVERDCTGCGVGFDVCPEDAIEMTRRMPLRLPVFEAWTGCGTCVEACPFEAIEVTEAS